MYTPEQITAMEEALNLFRMVRVGWIHHNLAPRILAALYKIGTDIPCEHASYFIKDNIDGAEFCSTCGEYRYADGR